MLAEAGVLLPRSKTATWEDYVVRSVSRYRDALVRHPNAAPLMAPGVMPPTGLMRRDHLVTKMVEGGVPLQYCYAIIDSVETLAFGSALFNPQQLPPKERYTPRDIADVPELRRAIGAAPRTPERLFRLELQAVLEGWKSLIAQAGSRARDAEICYRHRVNWLLIYEKGRRRNSRRRPFRSRYVRPERCP